MPFEWIRKLVPNELDIDQFEGKCYVSIVAFNMEKIRPRFLPSFSPISFFPEVNVRTYVSKNGKSGVYFLSIEAQKTISIWLAKCLSGLPYQKARFECTENQFSCFNSRNQNHIKINFSIGKNEFKKNQIDYWLTERYCLYLVKNDKIYRYEIHHKEWDIFPLIVHSLDLKYSFEGKTFDHKPDLMHYSPGVQVVAWKKHLL